METIRLYRLATGWVATFSDPTVKQLFGTDTLPTAFTAQASVDVVRTEIQRRNPGADVQVRTGNV